MNLPEHHGDSGASGLAALSLGRGRGAVPTFRRHIFAVALAAAAMPEFAGAVHAQKVQAPPRNSTNNVCYNDCTWHYTEMDGRIKAGTLKTCDHVQILSRSRRSALENETDARRLDARGGPRNDPAIDAR